MLAAMGGIAGERPAPGIDHEIELFQRELADQDGTIVRDLDHVHRASSPLDRQPYGIVHANLGDADCAPHRLAILLLESELVDQAPGYREHRCPCIDQGVRYV